MPITARDCCPAPLCWLWRRLSAPAASPPGSSLQCLAGLCADSASLSRCTWRGLWGPPALVCSLVPEACSPWAAGLGPGQAHLPWGHHSQEMSRGSVLVGPHSGVSQWKVSLPQCVPFSPAELAAMPWFAALSSGSFLQRVPWAPAPVSLEALPGASCPASLGLGPQCCGDQTLRTSLSFLVWLQLWETPVVHRSLRAPQAVAGATRRGPALASDLSCCPASPSSSRQHGPFMDSICLQSPPQPARPLLFPPFVPGAARLVLSRREALSADRLCREGEAATHLLWAQASQRARQGPGHAVGQLRVPDISMGAPGSEVGAETPGQLLDS